MTTPRPATLRLILTVLLAAAGNLLEWYDFAVFGIFAQEIGQCFFVGGDAATACAGAHGGDAGAASIYSYILFAGGFLVRPVGGVLFGWVADHKGRAASLMLSIVGMAAPTLAISVLPCRDQIGLAAPVLLTLFRLMQGVAAGGELPGALVYAVERAPPHFKATFGALVQSTGVGSVLANGVAALLQATLGPTLLCEWAWRIPFVAGGCTAALVCVVRLVGGLPQSDEWAAAVAGSATAHPSLLRTLHTSWRPVVLITLVLAYSMAGYYLLFVWITHYLRAERGLSAFGASSLLNSLWAVAVLASGLLTDRLASPFGGLAGAECWRRRGGADRAWLSSPATVTVAFGLLMLVAAQPVFGMLRTADAQTVALLQGLLALLHALSVGPLQVWMVLTLDDVATRATCLGVAYNLGSSLFGGTAPLLASALTAATGGPSGAGAYLALVTGLSISAVVVADRLHRRGGLEEVPLAAREGCAEGGGARVLAIDPPAAAEGAAAGGPAQAGARGSTAARRWPPPRDEVCSGAANAAGTASRASSWVA